MLTGNKALIQSRTTYTKLFRQSYNKNEMEYRSIEISSKNKKFGIHRIYGVSYAQMLQHTVNSL